MYILASHIISKYSGRPFVEFVEERIFRPLNMSATYSVAEAMESGHLTHAWTPIFARRIPIPLSEGSKELNAGPGGVMASISDLVS